MVACGRRFGKTALARNILTEKAIQHGMTTWWLAPTYPMAAQVWRDLKTSLTNLAATGRIKDVAISETHQRIDYAPSGGSIEIHSTFNADYLRGAGLDYAVLDEAAYMDPTVWPEVVRPMLLDRRGGAIFLSTPFGRNWFYNLFQNGMDPLQNEWASFRFQTHANPLIDRDELRQLERMTPARVWREEYLAEFIDDAGSVFRGVRAALYTPPVPIERHEDHRYIMGVDWGRDNDYTAVAVLDATTGELVDLERYNQVGWQIQRGYIRDAYLRWNPGVIWAEANSIGSVNIEALQQEGLPVRPFMTTSRSKGPLIEGLALAIERRDIALLPDPVLLNELEAYTLERLPGGGYRYSAPSGLHDDTVIAVALAWYGAQTGSLRLDFA
ncbi:MAG: terminase family protein [Anaerolineae bacterium]|nr:terminase family protein [Anaerolineae bacterium]